MPAVVQSFWRSWPALREKLGPRVAGEVQAVIDGMGTGRANLSKAPFDKIIPLAKAVDPSLTERRPSRRVRRLPSFHSALYASDCGFRLPGRPGASEQSVHAQSVDDMGVPTTRQPPSYFARDRRALHPLRPWSGNSNVGITAPDGILRLGDPAHPETPQALYPPTAFAFFR